jgi:hypothetical protein
MAVPHRRLNIDRRLSHDLQYVPVFQLFHGPDTEALPGG